MGEGGGTSVTAELEELVKKISIERGWIVKKSASENYTPATNLFTRIYNNIKTLARNPTLSRGGWIASLLTLLAKIYISKLITNSEFDFNSFENINNS